MRKLFNGLIAVFCGVLMMVSCSKGPNVSAYIPEDAIAVINFDLGSLMQKVDIKNIDDISFIKLARQELRSENPEMAALVDGIIKDPTSAGLNLKKDLTMAFSPNGSGVVAIAAMHKVSKFQEFLKDFSKGNCTEIQTEGKDYSMALVDNVYVAYNKKIAVMCGNQKDVERIMDLKKDESLANNKFFGEYWTKRSEISLWMNYESIFNMAEQFGGEDVLKGTGLPIEFIEDFRKASMYMNAVFDKGVFRFVAEVQNIDSKKWAKMYGGKFNSDLLKYIPENSYALMSIAMNGEKMAEMYANMNNEFVDFNEPVVGDKSLVDIFKMVGGSCVVSLYDFATNEKGSVIPLIALAGDLNDADAWRKMLEDAGVEQRDGYFAIPDIGLGFGMYFAVKEKIVFSTNSEEAVQKFLAGDFGKGLKSDLASKAKKGNYYYMNLDLAAYPDAVRNLIPQNIASLLTQYLDYSELYMNSVSSGEWDIYIKDKKENSLLSTLHFVDNNLVELGKLTDSFGGSDCPEVTEEFYVDDEDLPEEFWDE